MADMGVGGGRGGMGQLCGGDGAHRLALGLGQLQQSRHGMAIVTGTTREPLVAVNILERSLGNRIRAHGEHFVVHLHAGHVRRHGGGGVCGLGIVGEGLDAGGILQGFHGQLPLFPHLVDLGGGDCGGAHAIGQEEDDVLGRCGQRGGGGQGGGDDTT